MPVAMLLIDWDSKIGAVLKAKVPGDFADYYREDLNTEIMRIFTSHAMGDATAGFASLSIRIGGEEYNVASYYTGLVREEEQYCISLLLTPTEDPKVYEAAITSIVSPITNAVVSMTDAELQVELDNTYRRIIRLAGMTDESRLARLFSDEVSRAVFPKLWKGGISKENLEEWLKMVTGLPSVSVDSIIAPFEELGLVKTEWVDEIGRTCIFLVKDLEIFRAPPLTAMDAASSVLDPELAAFNGCAGETNEGGIRQGVVHMPGKAIDEIVLTAMRLVGDNNDIAPLRQQRVAVAFVFRQKLLDGGKNNTAGSNLQQLPQIGPSSCLNRSLAQQFAVIGKGAEKLIVQIVAIGDHQYRRIFHIRMPDHLAGKKHHRQAFT